MDGTFNIDSAVSGTIHSITVQPDGKEIIGGEFDLSIWSNPVTRNVARLNVDGSLDNSFVTETYGANGEVDASALQPDGRVLIAGQFTAVNGVARNGIARLYGTAPLLLTAFGVISDHYGFDLTGESNAVAVLEVSTNFVDWAALATNTIGAGALSFRDPASVSSPQRFYRAQFQ